MSDEDKLIEEARSCIDHGDFKSALQHCKAVLKTNKTSYDAWVYAGKAAFSLQETAQAEIAYQHAIESQPHSQPAWQGLADLYTALNNVPKSIEVYEKLAHLTQPSDPRHIYTIASLADAYKCAGRLQDAADTLRSLLGPLGNEAALAAAAAAHSHPGSPLAPVLAASPILASIDINDDDDDDSNIQQTITSMSKETRLALLCQLADIQLAMDEAALETAFETELHGHTLPPVMEESPSATAAAAAPSPPVNPSVELPSSGGRDPGSPSSPTANSNTPAQAQAKRLAQRARQQALQRTTDPPERSGSMLQLDLLAAQALVDDEETEHSTADTLVEIILDAPLALRYSKYMDEFLKRCLLKLFSTTARSVEREHFRLSALREAHALVARGGCCTPLPYEAALWLLEEEEEIRGGQVCMSGGESSANLLCGSGTTGSRVISRGGGGGHAPQQHDVNSYRVRCAFDNFAIRMIHQFPTNPSARVCLGLLMRRKAHAQEGTVRPVPQALRRQLEALLSGAMTDDQQIDCASGWKALAELQYENRKYEDAHDTGMRGLRWLQARRARGHEALTQIALALRLVIAKSLRRMGKLEDAEMHFKSLAGWTTEGEGAFAELSGAAPQNIHQQALRGIALCALGRGDRAGAKAQYERILGKAALGRGPGEHWAHGDYGWLLFEDGDLQAAKEQLEQAVQEAQYGTTYVTDSQLGEHQYRLGEVYWSMRGRYKNDKKYAYLCFLEAARAEGHAQAPALAGLGRYLDQVEKKPEAAARCFKKALALDPTLDIAGDGLCRQLMNGGKREAAFLLCREIAARSPNASWAIKRSGFLWLDKCNTTIIGLEQQEQEGQEQQQQYAEQAIDSFQKALGVRPGDAACWEGLGAAYQLQGRLTAALKAHSKAVQLDEGRFYAAVQCGRLHLALGALPEALDLFQTAINIEEGKKGGRREGDGGDDDKNEYSNTTASIVNPVALLGAAEVEIAIAAVDIGLGATAAAADILGNAVHHAHTCATTVGCSTIHSAWKLVGDALLLHTETSPSEKTREIVYGKVLLNRRGGGGDGGEGGEKDTITPSDDNVAVSGLLESWKKRIHAVRAASRAYAKALFLRPSNAGSWRDVALALHHQALLIDQLPPHKDIDNKQSSLALSHQAERMLHAALRASPTSSPTWAALGIVLPLHTSSSIVAKKEYALSRAIQLDPCNTTAWVALSRLYLSTGELGLAQDALRNARTHDPTESSIWDAMSAVAAVSGDYQSSLEYAEQSMLLGGNNNNGRRRSSGGEGMMAFVQGAIMHTGMTMSMKGALYAVAKKLPVVRPLEAGAHVACGLACESRGDWNGAVGCYYTALELLVSAGDSSNDNSNGGGDGRREVEYSLARALTGAGIYKEAIALYEKLLVVVPSSSSSSFSSSYIAAAETWLGYARALLLSCCGGLRSENKIKQTVVLSVLEKAAMIVEQHAIPAAAAEGNGDCAVEAITLLLQLEYKRRRSGDCADVDALSVCLKYLSMLREMDNPPKQENIEQLWCTVAAAIATTGNVGKTVDCLYQATTSSSSSSLPAPHSAVFENNMQHIIAAATLLSSSSTKHHQHRTTTSAERFLTKAIHTTPWNISLRTSLAGILTDTYNTNNNNNKNKNNTIFKSKLAGRVVSLNQAISITNKDNTILPWWGVSTAIEARTLSLLKNTATLKKSIHKELVTIAKYLHAHPVDAESWYLGAVLATQLASLDLSIGGGSGSYYYYTMALSWCRSALGRIQQKLHLNGKNSNNNMWQLMEARVQLCICDCLLHSSVADAATGVRKKKPYGDGAALSLAESVYQRMLKTQEEGGGNDSLAGSIAAAAQRQIARCHWAEGSLPSAEDVYEQAIQQYNDMLSVLELSQLLLSSSEEGKKKAVELLESHASSSCLSHKAALMMQLALTHASLQKWEQAKEPVRKMMDISTTDTLLHSEYKEYSSTAATVLAIICLQQALSQQQQQETDDKSSTGTPQLIGEARRALLDTINNNYENNGVVIRTLLAQIESAGTSRKKEEKVAAHINAVKNMMMTDDGLDIDASHQLLQFLNTLL